MSMGLKLVAQATSLFSTLRLNPSIAERTTKQAAKDDIESSIAPTNLIHLGSLQTVGIMDNAYLASLGGFHRGIVRGNRAKAQLT